MVKARRKIKKIFVGIVGSLVVIFGIILIPYPGPGWLTIFFGFTILATEFMWAKGILEKLRTRYDQWQLWLVKQPFIVQAFFWLLTAAVVVFTTWLCNGFGLINSWFNLHQDWLVSPFIHIDPTP